jgi:hypothetical protein
VKTVIGNCIMWLMGQSLLCRTSGVREREVLSPDGLSESDRKLAEKEAEVNTYHCLICLTVSVHLSLISILL